MFLMEVFFMYPKFGGETLIHCLRMYTTIIEIKNKVGKF